MKREIIPACMPEYFGDIEGVVSSVKGHVQTVQLDLMDGNYVPEATWPFMYATDFKLEDLKKEDIGFPFWEQVNYELDLMVSKPEERLDTWLNIGASRVIFHYASVADWKKIADIDSVIRNFTEIGVAITIHDDLKEVMRIIDQGFIDFVQVMGIAHIGYMGEPFDEASLDIIRNLRASYPNMIISVDGGVSEYTIPLLCEAGVDRLVSGSGVFGQGLASENVAHLGELTEI